MQSLRDSRERGEDPPSGKTEKPVTGFRGRSGRTFRAKLKIERTPEDKWRVDFNEEWAKEPPKSQDEDGAHRPKRRRAPRAGEGRQPDRSKLPRP